MPKRALLGTSVTALFASVLLACSSSASDPPTSDPGRTNPPANEPANDSDDAPVAPAEPPAPASNEPKPNVPTSGTATYESNLTDFAISVADIRIKHEAPELKSDGTYESELNITLTDRPGACADYTARIHRRGTKRVKIEIEARGATAQEAQIVPGTYVIDHFNDTLDVDRYELDDQCFVSNYKPLPFTFSAATVKTVTITSITATHVKGSYEVRGSDGRYIEGVFDADICPIVDTSTAFTCAD